ncbi:hypothetical protein PVK06_035717 [Gossypium arboreum]|uniref:Uncharacterized protein n=1 Tax=Gossypium arboreum TaxID=29729 RepID=A0ABR0NHJ8_GOSAR|nr:hypothetical protein PVK06_035717 [Gossypium arboreum]
MTFLECSFGMDQIAWTPGHMYKMKILGEAGNMVGRVSKLDFNTNSRTRGHFVRIVVYVNLDKPLVSQVLINDETQRVEYEFLQTIYFSCGRYGHVKELWSTLVEILN